MRYLLPLTIALSCCAPALAATTPVPAPTRVVQGTTQLNGENARLGQTFTIGKADPLNFTLQSAEYSVGRIRVGQRVIVAGPDEKLLVLHYTVHNPQKRDVRYDWSALKFTVVDPQSRNHEFIEAAVREGTTEPFDAALKPAQKVTLMTAVVVPAAGVMPKLIVRRGSDTGTPVLRYDLRTQVGALNAPYADPADKAGATALARVRVPAGAFHPLQSFDVRFDGAAFTRDPLQGAAPTAGQRYLVVTMTLRNASSTAARYYWGIFNAALKDANGETVPYNQILLKGSRDERAEGDLGAGEQIKLRLYFTLPEDVRADNVAFAQTDGGRTYLFDVKAAN